MSNLFFSRDTKVYLETVDAAGDRTGIWEVPVLNGYAFSQSTNASTITLSEMSDATGVSRRGQKVFNDSVSPSEWSFDVYVRPTVSSSNVYAVEEALWANFVANNSFTDSTKVWSKAVSRTSTTLGFDFDDSNVSELGTFNLYFVIGGNNVVGGIYTTGTGGVTVYKLERSVVNEATINFEVDGITMISWGGMGGNTNEVESLDTTTNGGAQPGVITTGIDLTTNYIRNRLTAMTLVNNDSSTTYTITLTGGSITFSNNISFLTPESLGIVNQPLGHVTGTRSISGSFTAYLDDATNGSQDLLSDLQADITNVTNSHTVTFYVGGKTSGQSTAVAPGLKFEMGQCHLEIPTINNDDVIAVEVNFTALPTTLGGTDEVTGVTYYGV